MSLDSSSSSSSQKVLHFWENVDENVNNYSCFNLLKSNPDDPKQQLPVDIPQILFEEASFPAGMNCSHARDVYSSSAVLPEEGENGKRASPQTFLSILEIPDQAKIPVCTLDAHLNCRNCIDFQMKSEEVYSQCIIDIPSVNGNSNSPESFEEGVESFKSGNSPTSVLWRESSLKLGGKLMQSSLNLNNSKDKPVTEKVHDIPINRWRRYKRSASFDSRKVALMFSVLSSLGTLVLIYLTIRVRQRAEGFVHI
ncbi:PREDICTED: uncharacterized protein LOC109341680 isoform X2 [Lupinus angustifolius]|uniref:uncharacterized protein LOC109341680 isoform X2 n=1 Tax=Lupinus angustifolius TaxID=3871 RepID=UPI00092F4666|nr:PREDICTED: uncharacterized protein LOC109341680 isoform X2 [Lupinus angustifolius]